MTETEPSNEASIGSAAPIVRAAHVERTPEEAFRIFTDEIGAWWPLPTHGVFGAESGGVAFVDGRLVELSTDGSETTWGEITTWDPPHRLVFTWHPGRTDSTGSSVEVEFNADGDGTRVVLEHRGWETFGPEAGVRRRDYVGPNAWGYVLDHFADATEATIGFADLSDLAAAADRFFAEASTGGFGPPADGDWTAEQVIAHVTLNDAAMLAVSQGIIHDRDVVFDNVICQDRAVLDDWVRGHDDLDALVAAGRRVSCQLIATLARLSPGQRQHEVPCHLRHDGQTMLDDARPWGTIAIDIQTATHLPAHTRQLSELRTR